MSHPLQRVYTSHSPVGEAARAARAALQPTSPGPALRQMPSYVRPPAASSSPRARAAWFCFETKAASQMRQSQQRVPSNTRWHKGQFVKTNLRLVERIKPLSFSKRCLQHKRTRWPSRCPTDTAAFSTLPTANCSLQTSNLTRLLLSATEQRRAG